jgi:transposase
VGRGDLSDEQWAGLERVLPSASGARAAAGPAPAVVDGIRRRVPTGAPWRDLPACYGPWQTAYRVFRHAAGAHTVGAAQREPPGGISTEPADHGLGRSRASFSTKVASKVISLVIRLRAPDTQNADEGGGHGTDVL